MDPVTQGIFNSPYVDTIIALVLVYALLSILVSILLEAWNKCIKERGVFLQRAVYRLLDDPLNRNFGYLIYQHPIINKMRRDGNSYPYYIPSEGFANALIDTLADQAVKFQYVKDEDGRYTMTPEVYGTAGPLAGDPGLDQRLQLGVRNLADSEFKRLMVNFIDRNKRHGPPDAGNAPGDLRLDMDRLKQELGRWFDDYMDRASGEYKDDQRRKLRIIGLVVALALNVDSLHLTKVFLLDQDLRNSMVAEAERVSDQYEEQKRMAAADTLPIDQMLRAVGAPASATALPAARKAELVQQLADTQYTQYQRQAEQVLDLVRRWQLPLGWNPGEAPWSWFSGDRLKEVPKEFKPSQRAVLNHFQKRNRWSWMNLLMWLAGIGVTTISLSMGAPFWFELLVKLINMRRAGPKPQSTTARNT